MFPVIQCNVQFFQPPRLEMTFALYLYSLLHFLEIEGFYGKRTCYKSCIPDLTCCSKRWQLGLVREKNTSAYGLVLGGWKHMADIDSKILFFRPWIRWQLLILPISNQVSSTNTLPLLKALWITCLKWVSQLKLVNNIFKCCDKISDWR